MSLVILLMLNSLPFNSFADAVEVVNSNDEMIWSGEFYENHDFQGEAVKREFESIDFSWGKDTPIDESESPLFSAVFTSTINIEKDQTAKVVGSVHGDFLMYLNDELIFENDGTVESTLEQEVALSSGTNKFRIEYKNSPEDSQLKIDVNVEKNEQDVTETVENDSVNLEETPTDKWLASYYQSIDLTGEKQEELIEKLKFDSLKDFSNTIPLQKSFSASYIRSYTVTEQTNYEFSGTVQGGIRLYVDEKLVFEDWENGTHELNSQVTLDEGTHEIVVEYKNDNEEIPTMDLSFSKEVIELEDKENNSSNEEKIEGEIDESDNQQEEVNEPVTEESLIIEEELPSEDEIETNNDADMKQSFMTMRSARASIDEWTAEYYPNLSFSGNPFVTTHEKLDLNWGGGSPHSSIPVDGFSAIFKKKINVPKTAFYRISGRADDGIRVSIDDKTVIDRWSDGVNVYENDILLTPGVHDIKVEYYEKKYSAAISLDIKESTIPNDVWTATYYPTKDFRGEPYRTTIKNLDLYWGAGSPAAGIPTDNFSAIFEKNITIDKAGTYQFTGRADDGIRVYVDGEMVINSWGTGVNTYDHPVKLTKGNHAIRVEYYDEKYSAAVSLDIKESTVPEDAWTAIYYPKKDFQGTPYKTTVKKLDLNWGSGSPAPRIPSDNFSAVFEKNITIDKAGTYQFTGRADDGIRVYVDGKMVVNSWGVGVNTINQLIELTQGSHTIRVEYYEEKYGAAIKLDLNEVSVPKDAWLAKYYPNKTLSGVPVKRYENKLDLNWGGGSPAVGIPTDNFSATFEKNVTIDKAGTYQFTGRADDGIRVYVDGNMVINSWGTGVNQLNHLVELTKGVHAIRVEYYDEKYSAAIKLDLNEVSAPKDAWLATYYPNKTFTGLPVKRYENKLDLNWGNGSPVSSIPIDGFSGIFEKTITISEAGTYEFSGRADDGIRIFVDGKKELDLWKTGVNTFSKNIELPAGSHKIRVEYFEEKYSAALKLDITKATKQVIYKKTNYNLTYTEALNKQMSTLPQTDKYRNKNAFIHKDYVKITRTGAIIGNGVRLRTAPKFDNNNISATVNNGTKVTILGEVVGDLYEGSTKWYKINYGNKTLYVHHTLANPNAMVATTTAKVNIRETASDNGHIYATLASGTSVNIVKEGPTWHEISYDAWRNAKRADVEQYLNPNNFSVVSKDYFQFLSLKGSAGISTTEVNNKILAGKGILAGKASAFAQAAVTHNINEIYLISHALLETGNGTSQLAKGVLVSSVDGKPVTPKIVYNTYGVGAYDSCPLKCGTEYAYKMGWFTPEAAIIGGAQFISKNYVSVGQDTLYKMKWNPSAPGVHQYATDIGWAVKQTSRIQQFYSVLDTYTIVFDIPVYR